MNEVERAILSVFREFDVGGGQMLLLASFLSRLDKYGMTEKQFYNGMSALVQKGLVATKNQDPPGAYFLTEAGYQQSLNA